MVSVVMALFNGEKYLVEQLLSVLNQSYRIQEVILVDDCSKDKTVDIAKDFIRRYGLELNWHLYKNDKNIGYADNFMKAIKKCVGEYVFFCDQDDIWYPNRIEEMVMIMDANTEIKVLGSEYEPFYSTEDAPKISKDVLKRMHGQGNVEHVEFNSKSIFIGCEGCTMCVRLDFIKGVEKYWFSGWAHDEFVWKLSLCTDGLYLYHSKTLKRRLHSNNVSKRKYHELKTRVRFLGDLKKSHTAMLHYARDLEIDDKFIQLINRNINSVELRINLLLKKKLMTSIKLMIFHFNNYHSRKSILIEFLMAFRSKLTRIDY